MKTDVLMTVFFLSWLLCGCSLETFFCDGAPIAILSAIVAVAVAVVLGSKGGGDGTD